MGKRGCLLAALAGSTLLALAVPHGRMGVGAQPATPEDSSIPTVTIDRSPPFSVPTVAIPQPTATRVPPTPKPKTKTVKPKPKKPQRAWIQAYLTSYCPGSAGWIAATGKVVHYGMLANNYYRFGTHVFIPILHMTGVVEDRMGPYANWYNFDVWSPSCYGTPTGWYRVAILKGRS